MEASSYPTVGKERKGGRKRRRMWRRVDAREGGRGA